jgi:hypothetical protein
MGGGRRRRRGRRGRRGRRACGEKGCGLLST